MVTTSNVDGDNFNKLQTAYSACMAEADIQKAGIAPIQDLLGDLSSLIAGDNSTQGASGISDVMLYLEKLRIPSLLDFGVGADDKDPVSGFLEPRAGNLHRHQTRRNDGTRKA